MALLQVTDLAVEFRGDRGSVFAVNGITFALDRGETLGIVGESGSGKSVTSLAIMGLLPRTAHITRGSLRFEGHDLRTLAPEALRQLRGDRMAMVFQDPMTSLNPFLRVGVQLAEVLEVHRGLRRKDAMSKAVALLERVGIPSPAERAKAYPHELSGGMRQRVVIAMALLCEPDLLIADEPTTALDVTIQAQILELLKDLQRERGMAIVLITHDLGVVAGMTDRVMVLYGGQAMEHATTAGLFERPAHPYTRGLLASVPRLDAPDDRDTLIAIPGLPPVLSAKPVGCPFAARCTLTTDRCTTSMPPDAGTAGHAVYCFEARP